MNYEKLVQGILNIGEAMLQCGAEIFRVEDSLYRMYKSYGFMTYDVYVIPSNIQVTVETPEGEIITQIRHIESTGADYDKLNYLNAMSRYVCSHNPDEKELVRRFKKVMAAGTSSGPYHDRNGHAVSQCTWCDQRNAGCDAEELYLGFTGSDEFDARCIWYRIRYCPCNDADGKYIGGRIRCE